MSDIEDAQTVTVDAKEFIDMFEYMPEQANRACHELGYDVKERARPVVRGGINHERI